MDTSSWIVWIGFGALSGGSIIYLCRKIGAGIPWVSVICLSIAFHFWPLWYWRRYRPFRRALEAERERQFRRDNWAQIEATRY